MKRRFASVAVVSCALTLLCSSTFGWNSTGHMVVARVAWENLSPAQRDKCVQILKAAPAIATELEAVIPANAQDHDPRLFLTAATWPDMVRSPSSPNHVQSHPRWHFIDEPVEAPGFEARPAHGLDTEWDGADDQNKDPENAVQALRKNLYDLKNGPSPMDKARALCWVLHLVGDLHQPLHCASLFDANHPQGDNDGNAIRTRGGGASELHALWDNLLGRSVSLVSITAQATDLSSKHKTEVTAAATEIDPVQWAMQGRDLAQEVAYENGTIEDDADISGSSHKPVVVITSSYLTAARLVAQKQVVLAGLRLAGCLPGAQ